jgi:hypothetical protein
MSFGEVTLEFFGPFLQIGPFGHLEHLIYETLESVVVPGLVVSLWVENADANQEAFKFTWPGLVLLVASWLFHRIDGMIRLPLLIMTLGRARMVRVASLSRAYLLAMANIASDVLGFFMVRLCIKDGSLSPFLKNITIDLSSTSEMMFLLL